MPVALEILFLFALVIVNRLGFIYVVNQRLHYTFAANPARTFLYFMLMAAGVAALFPSYAAALYAPSSFLIIVLFLFMLVVVNPWIYDTLKRLHKIPAHLAKANPDQQFLLIDGKFLVSKTGDVIFQQTAVGILLLVLARQGMPFEDIVPLFALIFGLTHIHMFFSTKRVWAAYFTATAALAGFMFPFIILFVPDGIYYAIIVHMLWYVGSGAFFGFLENEASTAKK